MLGQWIQWLITAIMKTNVCFICRLHSANFIFQTLFVLSSLITLSARTNILVLSNGERKLTMILETQVNSKIKLSKIIESGPVEYQIPCVVTLV